MSDFILLSEYEMPGDPGTDCRMCKHLFRDFDDDDRWSVFCQNQHSQNYRSDFVKGSCPDDCPDFEEKEHR